MVILIYIRYFLTAFSLSTICVVHFFPTTQSKILLYKLIQVLSVTTTCF